MPSCSVMNQESNQAPSPAEKRAASTDNEDDQGGVTAIATAAGGGDIENSAADKATLTMTTAPSAATNQKKKKPLLSIPPPANKHKFTDMEVIELFLTTDKKKSDVINAINESPFYPKRGYLYKMVKKETFCRKKKTLVELLSKYELDSVEWNERVSRIARLSGQSDKQIRDIIGVRLVTASTDTATAAKNNQTAAKAKAAPALKDPPELLTSKKRQHSEISSDCNTNNADGATSDRTTINYDILKTALEAFKTKVAIDGATQEILAQYKAIGEMINKSSYQQQQQQQQRQQQQQPEPKKKVATNRHERVSTAISYIVPRFMGDTKVWKTSNKTVTKSTTCVDAQDFRTLLAALTGCDANRASKSLSHMLNNPDNSHIKAQIVKTFKEDEDNNTKLQKLIVSGIRDAIAHHTNEKGGTRKAASETFVKNIVTACVWNTIGDNKSYARDNTIYNLIGTSPRQIQNCRETVKSLIANNTDISTIEYKRKRRKDFQVKKSQSSQPKQQSHDGEDGMAKESQLGSL